MKYYCNECGNHITPEVFNYSTENFEYPLCIAHQNWFKELVYQTTPQTIALYFALKERGVPAHIEKHDGYKTIDIAVPEAKMNIEIDGAHHNFNPQQALADLKRTYHSFLKGYFTLRIPNSLVQWDIDQTADYVVGFLNENTDRT